MGYPQPSSVRSVQNFGQYFRLKTAIASGGDIYESEVGAQNFVLGTDSDIATVQVTYFDPSNVAGGNVSTAIISPDRSFVGRVIAEVDQYPVTNRRGRILISPADIFDQLWLPTSFAGGDVIQTEQPVLDVLQYFEALPSVSTQRSDKVFRAQYFLTPTVPGDGSWWVIPTYGRKSGNLSFLNLDGLNTVTVRVFGVKLSISGAPAVVGAQETQLATSALLANGVLNYNYKSSTDGMWDLFAIQFDNYASAALPTTIRLSDDAL